MFSEYCSIFNFEGDFSLMQWNKTGTAFNNQPTYLDNLKVRTGMSSNHEGQRWVGTRENRMNARQTPGGVQGNAPVGELTSPPFIIHSSKLYFLFAGSAYASKARVELLVGGLVVRSKSSSTGSESLVQMRWNVSDLLGREAQIRLVDSGNDTFVSFDGLKSNCRFKEGDFTRTFNCSF